MRYSSATIRKGICERATIWPLRQVYHDDAALGMVMGHIAHNLRQIYTTCNDSNTAASSPIVFQCDGGKLSLRA